MLTTRPELRRTFGMVSSVAAGFVLHVATHGGGEPRGMQGYAVGR